MSQLILYAFAPGSVHLAQYHMVRLVETVVEAVAVSYRAVAVTSGLNCQQSSISASSKSIWLVVRTCHALGISFNICKLHIVKFIVHSLKCVLYTVHCTTHLPTDQTGNLSDSWDYDDSSSIVHYQYTSIVHQYIITLLQLLKLQNYCWEFDDVGLRA